MNMRLWKFLILAIASLIIAGNIFVIEQVYRNAYIAYSSRNWPTTEGKIVASSWTARPGANRTIGAETDGYMGSKTCFYKLTFKYTYVVENVSYTNDVYQAGDTGTFDGECYGDSVKKIVSDFPVGSNIMVHYAPDDHANSVIVPGELSSNGWLSLFWAPAILALWVGLIFFIGRSRKRSRR
jgi:hypothetical protein